MFSITQNKIAFLSGMAFALLISFQAFADNDPNSWNSILRNPNLAVDAPQLNFNGTFVSIMGACVAGDKIQTTTTVTRCKPSPWNNDETEMCLEEEKVTLSIPMTETVCTEVLNPSSEDMDTVCLKSETRPVALTYTVDIVDRTRVSEVSDGVVMQKFYTIPVCGN